jgi:hypothetical protein
MTAFMVVPHRDMHIAMRETGITLLLLWHPLQRKCSQRYAVRMQALYTG